MVLSGFAESAVAIALADAEQRGAENAKAEAQPAGTGWRPVLDEDELIACDEGNVYLFAIQMDSGSWEYFVNRLVWDSESTPYWGDDDPGWEPQHGMWFCDLRPPPERVR